jgi:hypothetical protein
MPLPADRHAKPELGELLNFIFKFTIEQFSRRINKESLIYSQTILND